MVHRTSLVLIHLLAALSVATIATGDDFSHYASPWRTPWDYDGPRGAAHWGELDADYATCHFGREQSPVGIQNTRKRRLAPIRFEYQAGSVDYVINNGHTIRVNYHDAAGSGNFLVVGHKRYHLTQFHFHRPSEEYVHGKRYDMVLHLMHTADDGEVAGVAALLEKGHANQTIQQVWDHMPATEGQLPSPGVELNPAGMLPHDSGYFQYRGSVTAPPCTEGVQWFVLKDVVEISARQIAAFARLYPNDARPAQPLNGRVVVESE